MVLRPYTLHNDLKTKLEQQCQTQVSITSLFPCLALKLPIFSKKSEDLRKEPQGKKLLKIFRRNDSIKNLILNWTCYCQINCKMFI